MGLDESKVANPMRARTSTLGETGDLHAPLGSRDWAVAVRQKLASCLHDAEFSSEQARVWFDAMRRHEGWKQLEARGGRRFISFEEFCIAKQPQGLGYEVEAIEQIIRERKQAEARAKAIDDKTVNSGSGPLTKEERDNDDIVINRRTGLGNSADYLTARIKRDHPEVFERMKAGEFSSVRQAALEAGIVRKVFQCPLDPERAAAAILKRFSGDDLRRLLRAMEE